MSRISIGGYKNSEKSGDLDLSPEVLDTTAADTTEAAEETETDDIQDTSQEVQETGQFDAAEEAEEETTSTTESEEAEESAETDDDNTSTEETTSAPDGETESTESTESGVADSVSDELIFKALSEKLGKEITSFDDLNEEAIDPLKDDDYLKSLVKWRDKTGRPIEDWIKYQKDYSTVSDEQVAREYLQLEYPELSPEDINLELTHKYISSDDDLDSEASIKNLELKKIANKGRKALGELVSELGTPNQTEYSAEVQQDIAIAKQFKTLQSNNVQATKVYNQGITSKAAEFKSIKMDLEDGVSIDYKLPQGSEKTIVSDIQNAPNWKNKDGSWNHGAVVRDAAIIANYQSMLKLAYEQGKNSGTDETIRETKNSTLGDRSASASALPNKSTGAVIEGLDKYLGNQGMSIKRRKKTN